MSAGEGDKELFLSEARGALAAMDAALLEAEKSPEGRGKLDEVFRAAHTLKGMSAMMGLSRMTQACHALEDVLDAVRKGSLPLSAAADALFRGIDALGAAVGAFARGDAEPDLAPVADALLRLARAPAAEAEQPPPDAAPAEAPPRIESVEVRLQRLDLLMNLAEEMLVTKIRFDAVKAKMTSLEGIALVDVFGRLATELQYQVTQARLVPLRVVFDRFPRMTRDLAKRQHKQVDLELSGGDIELDRRVGEELGEALVHLLRNAVDHGIETPEARAEAGKPPRGRVRVSAAKAKDVALVEVEDDGAGLDLEGIRRAAQARGLLAPGASREEVLLAATTGLSTKPHPTDVSGRGLGLDIVKRKVEGLGGTLTVQSDAGKGARFTLSIPLSLAIVKGLLVEVAGRRYALPLAGIEKITTQDGSRVKGVLGRETIVLDGEDVPLLRLRALFGAPAGGPARVPVVVVGRGPQRLGLVVDALVTTQDVVLKPLDRMLRGATHFSGSTISGAGEPVLVLDVAGLLHGSKQEVAA